MGFILSFDATQKVLFIQIVGDVTDDIVLDGYQKTREWIAVHGQCSQISDYSSATSVKLTAEAIRKLASLPPLVSDQFLRIVVAPQDSVFGMARMFGAYGGQTRSRVDVVRTLREASELLGVTSLDLQPVD